MQVTEELLSWETIIAMVKTKDIKFGRTKYVMDSYKAHKARLTREWKDINSYCMHRMLGYPYSTEIVTATNESGAKEIRSLKFVNSDSDCPANCVAIMDNEFPYAFSPNVLHKVIWSADELTIDEYRFYLNKHFSDDDYDIIMFINPIHRKSVAGVHHAHALMRRKLVPITNIIDQEKQPDQDYPSTETQRSI